MDDLIRRQDAIDALGERPMAWLDSDYELGAMNQYDMDVNALKAVSPAQPLDMLTYLKGVNDGIEQCTERIKRFIDTEGVTDAK